MRIAFIGCVRFSYDALRATLALPDAQVVGVVTRTHSRFHADFHSLAPLARERDIPLFLADDHASEEAVARFLADVRPDVIYCLGWSSLLRKEILQIPRLGVMGFHPAALPRNRGRHPLVWALALGLRQTAATFFLIDEGVDAGPILSQEPIAIDDTDDAECLYVKMTATAVRQLAVVTKGLAEGTVRPIPQRESEATYWRKRSRGDGEIDWRMSARSIYNLVRALARPYVGAHCLYQGMEIKVWKSRMVETPNGNAEPGKVLAVEADTPIVRCGEMALQLIEHEFRRLPRPGEYIV